MISEYETDFYGWTREQAQALRARQGEALDWSNLAEEIESMGRSDADALASQLTRLLLHLLKWRYQPNRRSRSWELSMQEARLQISRRLRKSPSLKAKLGELLQESYEDARLRSARQTGLALETFPIECPWTFEQAMDEKFPTGGL
jgi:hypothetical protein